MDKNPYLQYGFFLKSSDCEYGFLYPHTSYVTLLNLMNLQLDKLATLSYLCRRFGWKVTSSF